MIAYPNNLPELRRPPREAGITEMVLSFDVPLASGFHDVTGGGPGGTDVTLEYASCSAPAYVPYPDTSLTGAYAQAIGYQLDIVLPESGLTNARTYRFNLGSDITCMANQNIEVRGLIGDVNNDGHVNATDRSVVVSAWTSAEHFSCATDVNNDGVTNATDRSIVVSAWTGGSATNCAPDPVTGAGGESMGAPGGEAPSGSEESTGGSVGGSDEVEPAAPTWTVVESPVEIEIRPLGGGEPTIDLLPHTTYEVHYTGAMQSVEGYLLQASGCAAECLASGSPASAGLWSDTGMFEYGALDESVQVLDDLPAGQADAGSAGYLCAMTTASAGELLLELRMYLIDSEAFSTYEMVGTVVLTVGTN